MSLFSRVSGYCGCLLPTRADVSGGGDDKTQKPSSDKKSDVSFAEGSQAMLQANLNAKRVPEKTIGNLSYYWSLATQTEDREQVEELLRIIRSGKDLRKEGVEIVEDLRRHLDSII